MKGGTPGGRLDPLERSATNAIERRRTRPMGVLADRTSIARNLFAIFSHENRNQGVSTPLPPIQNPWHYHKPL